MQGGVYARCMHRQPPAITSEVATRLTIAEAARYLGVSDDTIRRRVKDGALPAVLLANRYLISVADLDALIDNRTAA